MIFLALPILSPLVPLRIRQRLTQPPPFYPSLPPAQRMSLTLQSAIPFMPNIHKAMPRRKATRATRSLALIFGTHHVARSHNPQNPSRKPLKADKTARKSPICTVVPLAIKRGSVTVAITAAKVVHARESEPTKPTKPDLLGGFANLTGQRHETVGTDPLATPATFRG